jgi:murein DD-endopeptidase MepM/ murein hydrolase activator NlpD
MQPKLKLFGEALGLTPPGLRFRQALIAIRGEQDVPPTRFGLSSLSQLRPRIATTLWRGRFYLKRTALITNLFNHRQPPIELGWSVRKTDVEDFRGRDLTYDSHNGTDFAVPVGSLVTTAAPGQVVRIAAEFNRGGLKIFIDHGRGLMTCSAHLARSLVEVGDVLERGQPIALSGYSGLDALITFPFGAPHVHFNVWLNAEPVDPFPHHGEQSLWHGGELPSVAAGASEAFEPSAYSESRLNEAIASCITESSRVRLRATEPLAFRAAATVAEMNYYPTRFPVRVSPYEAEYPRAPRLDLPLAARDFAGVEFVDELNDD